ncbi:MAG: transcription elongation factor GreA [Mariprofundaceae bacterium]|nr:transcription elongation factor GreA [Mariprofundaceae bacterium]
MEHIPMTTTGAQFLRDELDHLRKDRRPKVIEAIATARDHGDLSENAEYHAAKEEQSFIEGRIQQISDTLARAQIISPSSLKATKIVFGATVTLFDGKTEKEVCYQIVGVDEADIEKFKISITSPIARALIGKDVDDIAVVHAPSGDREYEVMAINYI